MVFVPTIQVAKEDSRKICTFCHHTFKKGQPQIIYVASTYHQFINIRACHADCFFAENIKFLPSERKKRKLEAIQLVKRL